jgi:hypothetical protein
MGYLGSKPSLSAALAIRRAHPLQQFGQPYDSRWADGAQACGATTWQFLIRFWTGKHYTLDQIAIIAGHPRNSGGLEYHEMLQLIYRLRLPYKIIKNQPFETAMRASNAGPVWIPTQYSWWPEWRGYVYHGIRADGNPNGFALTAGKTQLAGFSGRHATVLLGYLPWDDSDADTTVDAYHAFVMEPNHNSASRPEDPPYDVITTQQYRRAYDAYRSINGSVYAAVPTRTWKP